jgi:hypothetical protein
VFPASWNHGLIDFDRFTFVQHLVCTQQTFLNGKADFREAVIRSTEACNHPHSLTRLTQLQRLFGFFAKTFQSVSLETSISTPFPVGKCAQTPESACLARFIICHLASTFWCFFIFTLSTLHMISLFPLFVFVYASSYGPSVMRGEIVRLISFRNRTVPFAILPASAVPFTSLPVASQRRLRSRFPLDSLVPRLVHQIVRSSLTCTCSPQLPQSLCSPLKSSDVISFTLTMLNSNRLH